MRSIRSVRHAVLSLAASSLLMPGLVLAQPGQTAFTYQGVLKSSSGAPISGTVDVRFTAWNDLTLGVQVGPAFTATALTLVGGVITTPVDFGPIFDGSGSSLTPYYLQIEVRPTGGGAFTVLSPRQPFTSTPYALTTSDPNIPRLNGVNVFTQPQYLLSAGQASQTLTSESAPFGSVLILENNTPTLAADDYLGAINFNQAGGTPGQIGYRRGATANQDRLLLRVGDLPWASLTGAGNFGVGVTQPKARLHIANGTSFASASSNSLVQLDAAFSYYISLLTQNQSESGFLFSRQNTSSAEAGIIFNNNNNGSLQFRTGNNATRMIIGSDGNVQIANTLSASNLAYTTPRTSYFSLPPTALTGDGGVVRQGFNGAYGPVGTSIALFGSLTLPHGATITNVTVFAYDAEPSVNLQFFLQRTPIAGANSSAIVPSIATSGTPGAVGVSFGSGSLNVPIDNQSFSYAVFIFPQFGNWSESLAVRSIRVTYSMPAPVP
ncbi:MAG: hypothetical protein K2Y21_01045 [Phycisphaerales bacterium]|nr:hypothetical protein [Phycisphaerales bacterium]